MQYLNNEMQDDLASFGPNGSPHCLRCPGWPDRETHPVYGPTQTNKNELFGSPILVGPLEMPSDRMPE
jgi:hypothetical protein